MSSQLDCPTHVVYCSVRRMSKRLREPKVPERVSVAITDSEWETDFEPEIDRPPFSLTHLQKRRIQTRRRPWCKKTFEDDGEVINVQRQAGGLACPRCTAKYDVPSSFRVSGPLHKKTTAIG